MSLASAARFACAAAALAAALLWPPPAGADDRLQQSAGAWKAADNCARAAIKAYPDYTAAALAKRESYRRLCLRRGNLPDGEVAPAPAAPAAEPAR